MLLIFDLYWVAATIAAIMREKSPLFGSLTSYGGRNTTRNKINELVLNNKRDDNKFSKENKSYIIGKCANRNLNYFRKVDLFPQLNFILSFANYFFIPSLSRKLSFALFYIVGVSASLISLLTIFFFPVFSIADPKLFSEYLQSSNSLRSFQMPVVYFFRKILFKYYNFVLDGDYAIYVTDNDRDVTDAFSPLSLPNYQFLLIASVPNIFFLIHCLVRFIECTFINTFRQDGTDLVSLFSLISGCSFFLFASFSYLVCSNNILKYFLIEFKGNEFFDTAGSYYNNIPKTVNTLLVGIKEKTSLGKKHTNHLYCPSKQIVLYSKVICVTLFFCYIVFQIVLQLLQIYHHCILSNLQKKRLLSVNNNIVNSRTISDLNSSCICLSKAIAQPQCNSCKQLKKSVKPISADDSYLFPSNRGLFRHILEPHYSLEIVQYFFSFTFFCLIFITSKLFFHNLSCSLILSFENIEINEQKTVFQSIISQIDHFKKFTCLLLHFIAIDLFLPLSPLFGCMLFTTLNLNISANEHRRFWERSKQRNDIPKYNLIPYLV